MSREFVTVVTDGMLDVAFGIGACEWDYDDAIRAALAHPDFQRQLRAYVAEQMRGLVPEADDPENYHLAVNRVRAEACAQFRAETLANIERWEQQK